MHEQAEVGQDRCAPLCLVMQTVVGQQGPPLQMKRPPWQPQSGPTLWQKKRPPWQPQSGPTLWQKRAASHDAATGNMVLGAGFPPPHLLIVHVPTIH